MGMYGHIYIPIHTHMSYLGNLTIFALFLMHKKWPDTKVCLVIPHFFYSYHLIDCVDLFQSDLDDISIEFFSYVAL